jgi:hypothetical protein
VAPPDNVIPHNFSLGLLHPAPSKSLAHFLSLDVNGRAHRVRVERLIIGGWRHMPKATRKAPVRTEPHPTRSFALPAPGIRVNLRYKLALMGLNPGLCFFGHFRPQIGNLQIAENFDV